MAKRQPEQIRWWRWRGAVHYNANMNRLTGPQVSEHRTKPKHCISSFAVVKAEGRRHMNRKQIESVLKATECVVLIVFNSLKYPAAKARRTDIHLSLHSNGNICCYISFLIVNLLSAHAKLYVFVEALEMRPICVFYCLVVRKRNNEELWTQWPVERWIFSTKSREIRMMFSLYCFVFFFTMRRWPNSVEHSMAPVRWIAKES